MADPKGSEQKSLEMRVAELEDKLSKVHITEDEMKAFQKVSALLGASPGAAATPTAGCVADCTGCITECVIRPCIVRFCTIRQCTIRQCTIRQCTVFDCFECGGSCAPGGGTLGGGGFGSLGG